MTTSPQLYEEELRRTWGWFLALGIITMILMCSLAMRSLPSSEEMRKAA